MTKASDMHALNDDELSQRLAEAREEIFNLRFQLAMGKQDNSARLGHVRRDIARALTVQRERALGIRSTAPEPRPSRRANKRKAVADA